MRQQRMVVWVVTEFLHIGVEEMYKLIYLFYTREVISRNTLDLTCT